MEYASNGKGNLAVTLGAIGTGLGVLNDGINLLGGNASGTSSNYVTKDEMNMIQELASKDSQIALLQADKDSETKMIEVYKQAHQEIADLRDSTAATFKEIQTEINTNRREQDAWNANQSVLNSQMAAAIATNSNSITSIQNVLNQITMLKVPNSAVCPGWGSVSITPTVTTGTTVA